MEFIQLTCPNCNGKIEKKEGKTFKCPFCETELMLKENHVYHVDQTINHYYGTQPQPKVRSGTGINGKALLAAALLLAGVFGAYLFWNTGASRPETRARQAAREMPESPVLISFLQEILDKGAAAPTPEELARIRYLAVDRDEEKQWRFDYSFSDPFTDGQAKISTYITRDKMQNTQRIEQKDFEAFSGLTALDLKNTYEISQSNQISFAHMKELKSYGGAFNESFRTFAGFFGDKSRIVELTTQIRSNQELAMLLEFPNLSSLAITYVDESVTDFHLLNQLPLKSLSLTFVDRLDWLSSLTGLESLEIHYSESADFKALYALTQLQRLHLEAVPNLKTVDFVQNMPVLQVFQMNNTKLATLAPLTGKASLTALQLTSMSQLGSVGFVNSLPSLREFVLSGYYGEEVALVLPQAKHVEVPGAFIRGLEAPSVTALAVHGSSREFNVSNLVKFKQLEQLTLRGISGIANVRALDQLPRLQELSLYETSLNEETGALFSLQHVTAIACTECSLTLEAGSAAADGPLQRLALTQTYFRMNNTSVSEVDKVLPYFAALSSLRSFTLQDSSIQSLQFMEKWQAVEELHLENNAISNLEPLTRLPKLQRVFLTGNPVQNQSVLGQGVKVY